MPDSVLAAQQRAALARAARLAQRDPTPANQAALDDARTTYRAHALEQHIRQVVDAAPPLTAEQRDRLALLLRGAA